MPLCQVLPRNLATDFATAIRALPTCMPDTTLLPCSLPTAGNQADRCHREAAAVAMPIVTIRHSGNAIPSHILSSVCAAAYLPEKRHNHAQHMAMSEVNS